MQKLELKRDWKDIENQELEERAIDLVYRYDVCNNETLNLK
jgi:hypothetical protein